MARILHTKTIIQTNLLFRTPLHADKISFMHFYFFCFDQEEEEVQEVQARGQGARGLNFR